jgi:hypothetical protein
MKTTQILSRIFRSPPGLGEHLLKAFKNILEGVGQLQDREDEQVYTRISYMKCGMEAAIKGREGV